MTEIMDMKLFANPVDLVKTKNMPVCSVFVLHKGKMLTVCLNLIYQSVWGGGTDKAAASRFI